MSFQPAIVGSGIVGWRMLQRTYDTQFAVFNKGPALEREVSRFLEEVPKIETVDDFVRNRDVLRVALGAFGLQDDLNNTYFIKKVLEDGTIDPRSLANRLGDRRYKEFSEFFGFGPAELKTTGLNYKMQEIADRYREMSFESAIGQQDNSLRIAMYAQRELQELADLDESERTKWFTIMADPPLREMIQTALNLPSSFSQLDIDAQLPQFQKRMRRLTGSDDVSQFTEGSKALKRVTDIYLARSQVLNGTAGFSSGSVALTLLQLSAR